MTLGERIRKQRTQLGYSREDLCAITGISHSQMVRYESNDNKPTSDVIVALARGLGVTPNWLLGVEPDTHEDGLTELERTALAVFRSKPTERQPAMIELLKIAQ